MAPTLPRPRKPLRPGSKPYWQQYGAGSLLPGPGRMDLYSAPPKPYAPPYTPGTHTMDITGGEGYVAPELANPYTGSFYMDFGGTTTESTDGAGGTATTPASPGAPGGIGGIDIWQKPPDYSGILTTHLTDWTARLNAGLAAGEAQRQSRARAAINRLGVRNPAAMLDKLSQYGISERDLQLAADNPWSELKAIDLQAADARGQAQAGYAGRGGFRSGGNARAMERIEEGRARNEAMATEETLSGLSQDMFEQAQWEREQRDALDQRAAEMEFQLAQAYQPYAQTAYWDSANGGYRLGNQIYDQYGNLLRTV